MTTRSPLTTNVNVGRILGGKVLSALVVTSIILIAHVADVDPR